MSEINEALTRKLAELARLELTDEEVRTFTPQLGGILKYVELLGDVNVEGIEPLTTPIELQTPLREDAARPSPLDSQGRPKILDSAPEEWEGGFKVPQIV